MRWLMRGLAVWHIVWGLLLVLCASYVTWTALAHMLTGKASNIVAMLFLVGQYAAPLALLGAWMLALAHRIWVGKRSVRTALLVTHGILLVLGIPSIMIGVHAVRAAEISTARGGGLLSPLAWLPLILGIFIAALALPSVVLALTAPRSADPIKK